MLSCAKIQNKFWNLAQICAKNWMGVGNLAQIPTTLKIVIMKTIYSFGNWKVFSGGMENMFEAGRIFEDGMDIILSIIIFKYIKLFDLRIGIVLI
jgi:hypothetical protein